MSGLTLVGGLCGCGDGAAREVMFGAGRMALRVDDNFPLETTYTLQKSGTLLEILAGRSVLLNLDLFNLIYFILLYYTQNFKKKIKVINNK